MAFDVFGFAGDKLIVSVFADIGCFVVVGINLGTESMIDY